VEDGKGRGDRKQEEIKDIEFTTREYVDRGGGSRNQKVKGLSGFGDRGLRKWKKGDSLRVWDEAYFSHVGPRRLKEQKKRNVRTSWSMTLIPT